MDNYYFVIGLALVGFVVLAAALLVPIFLFLKREERTAERWTEEYLNPTDGSNEVKTEEPNQREEVPSKDRSPVDGSPLR